MWDIFSSFVAFSEFLNFIRLPFHEIFNINFYFEETKIWRNISWKDWNECSIRINFTIPSCSSTTWFWDWPSGFLDINLAFYSFSIIHLHFWSVFTDWTVIFGRFAKTKFKKYVFFNYVVQFLDSFSHRSPVPKSIYIAGNVILNKELDRLYKINCP